MRATTAAITAPTAYTARRDKRGRLVCCCGGYHFPHRKFGGACYLGPRADYYAAIRADVDPDWAAANLLWADKMAEMPLPQRLTRKQK